MLSPPVDCFHGDADVRCSTLANITHTPEYNRALTNQSSLLSRWRRRKREAVAMGMMVMGILGVHGGLRRNQLMVRRDFRDRCRSQV